MPRNTLQEHCSCMALEQLVLPCRQLRRAENTSPDSDFAFELPAVMRPYQPKECLDYIHVLACVKQLSCRIRRIT